MVMSMMMWRLAVDKTMSDIGQPGMSVVFCRRVSVSVGLIGVAVAVAVVDAVGTAMDGDSRVMRLEGLGDGHPVWRHGGGWWWWWWWWWWFGCDRLRKPKSTTLNE
jgi:hypothetical protein